MGRFKVYLILGLVFMIMATQSASALYVDDTILYSTGLNTSINITYPWNLTLFVIDTNYIYISNLSTSNPLETSYDLITFNITESDGNYAGTDIPYFSTTELARKGITSGLDDSVNGSIYVGVDYCAIGQLMYSSSAGTHTKVYSPGEWICVNNTLNVNLSMIEKGSGNTLLIDYNVSLFNCTGGNVTLEFSIYDEDSPTSYLNATADVLATYWYPGHFFEKNFSHSYTGNHTYQICIDPANETIYADILIKYTVDGGYTHYYYILNGSLTNTTQSLGIYNYDSTNNTQRAKLSAVDQSYTLSPGLYVKMLRFYPGENTWRLVQMDKTDEFARTYFHVREQDTLYKFIFQDYNTALKTTDELHFNCPTSDDCILTVVVPTSASISEIFTGYNYTYNDTTEIFTLTWSDITGLTDSITLQAWSDTTDGRYLWCNTSVASSSGSITCDLSTSSGYVKVLAYRTASPTIPLFQYAVDGISKAFYSVLQGAGLETEGVFMGGIVAVVIILLGAFSPLALVISVPVAFVVMYMFGWFNFINIGVIVLAAIMSIIIGFLVKRT